MAYRRERDIHHSKMDSTTEYAKMYQRAQRAARNGSSFSPPASPSPAYEFTRQHTWPGQPGPPHPPGSGAGSYEDRERGIPIRERQRDRGWDHRSHASRDYDGQHEQEYDDRGEPEYEYEYEFDGRSWQPSGSPRTPRTAGMTSGSSLGGSYGRRERDRERDRERERERERERDHDRERERDRDREKDRRAKEREIRERERSRELKLERERDERERQRDRDVCRQRMRYATENYPRRLRAYLMPVLKNQQAMDHATDIFVKLDQDARYLTQSANTLLESLTAVAEDQATGGNGTGLDDPAPGTDESSEDVTTTEESSALEDSETAAESVSSDADSDDNEQQFGSFGHGGDMPSFSSRRSSLANGSVVGGGGRRRSSASQRHSGSGADHQRKGSNSTTTGPASTTGGGSAGGGGPPPLMHWNGFRPFALNKHPDSVNDRRKSLMAFTQIISVTLLASLGVDTGSNGGRARLSTRGLLAELLRVLQPKDYRAYFRAAARVILLPEGGSIVSRAQPPDEMALEALERQLLGTAKFVPGVATSASSSPAPMMACLTYTSANHGTITLYRLDMGGGGLGAEGWPRRITPVSAMAAVPKELLRRTARSMPPSRRTVLKVAVAPPSGTDKKKDEKRAMGGRSASISEDKASSFDDGDKDKDDEKEMERLRFRWISMPQDTSVPQIGHTSTVDAPALSSKFLNAMGMSREDRTLSDGTTANTVQATLPAMFAWLHTRAAYLTAMDMTGPELQRPTAPSVSKPEKASPTKGRDRDRRDRDRDRDRERDRDYDDNASTSTSTTAQPSRSRMRRVVRYQHGPTPLDHDGKEPTIVVLHPSRGDWVTSSVFWTEKKE
ncbi:hypothetical protein SPBR_02374 [Sporothrix brasiliensis 5110]|uniref:Uncharacterized protein n=1 Tax=Sporothrix brasiliensis 5110 TaxID=1398154 RepID=A0A0C2EZX3_9PEZI|nr:uncharacterized protein SPBR_02374 [Sporothrix brasiliensis 5110]KIH92094.1 hypothetical protein SPBR_02374 [Sporothrix brasiliensis 5110]